MVMRSFQHVPALTRLHHGPDCLRALGKEADRLGATRVAVLCGASLAGQAGLMALVREGLDGRCAGVFDGVRTHSPEAAVQAAADALRDWRADAVLAVGGGSAIVTARAAGILLAEGRDVAALATRMDEDGRLHSPRLPAPKLPQLILPTTPTNAMSKAGSAILDARTGERRALFDPRTRAHAVFLHPDFLASAPPRLVIGAALHALGMAVEGLLAPQGNTVSEGALLQALRLFAARLPVPADGDEATRRGGLAVAAFLSGQGTDATGAGLATGLGHVIGSRFHGENGILTAILLPHALRVAANAGDEGLALIALGLGVAAPAGGRVLDQVMGVLWRLFDTLGVPRRLRDAGVPEGIAPDLAALAAADWFVRSGTVPLRDIAAIQRLIEEAW